MRATCWLRSVTMRTLAVVRRDGVADERRGDAGVAACLRQRRRRVVMTGDGDERRVAAEGRDVVRDVRGAADAVRLVVEVDDGTGASGEMRVTRPTMNVSSIASPTTRIRRAGEAARRGARARSARDWRQQHGIGVDVGAPPRTAA